MTSLDRLPPLHEGAESGRGLWYLIDTSATGHVTTTKDTLLKHMHTHCCHLPACTPNGNSPNALCDIVKESARELWNATGLVVADGCCGCGGCFNERTRVSLAHLVASCLWLCAAAIVCVSQEIRSVKLNSFYWQLIEYTKKKQDRGREQKRVERNPRRFSNGI